MSTELESLLLAELLDDNAKLSLAELCHVCQMPAEQVIGLVDYGIIEPLETELPHWRFHSVAVRRVKFVKHLQQDLGVNISGAALALELFEELELLRARLRRFKE